MPPIIKSDHYRADIDCLRSFSVLAVILFHCNALMFSGGFIGVDIFFVISGYVMYQSTITKQKFNFNDLFFFYQKRLFRIYPALLLMLGLTAIFCLLWLGTATLDSFGKQLFFASLSASNLLYAQGQNYFDQDTPVLLHTWSLGVEMQFYLLFPFIMIFLTFLKKHSTHIAGTLIPLLFLASLIWAQISVTENSAFFLLQNRAFEFLIGMGAAALPHFKHPPKYHAMHYIVPLLIGLILCSLFVQNGEYHPGILTLIPISFAALWMIIFANIAFATGRMVDLLSYMGRISYGIYLFHFPITHFAQTIFGASAIEMILANILITLPLAHLSYRYFETPIRRYGYKKSKTAFIGAGLILIAALALSGFGYITAKKAGWPERLKHFNPYAYDVSMINTQSKTLFHRGWDVKSGTHNTVLFIGDSVLQQYIDPIAHALNIPKEQIDAVTRGGCVLLKDVDFEDIFADISCNALRTQLYTQFKTYDYIIISENWGSYKDSVKNAAPDQEGNTSAYIIPFITKTIEHFKPYAAHIIVLGIHPSVTYTDKPEISPRLTKKDYAAFKASLRINKEALLHDKEAFMNFAQDDTINIIHPMDIFCPTDQTECKLYDETWSYFYDGKHLTRAGQAQAEYYFKELFNK